MVKVLSKYNERFIEWLKSINAAWNPDERAWLVPDEYFDQITEKAKDFNVQGLRIVVESTLQKDLASQKAAQQATQIQQIPQMAQTIVQPVTQQQKTGSPPEGTIRMRVSEHGRFVLIDVRLLAFMDDVKELVEGKRKTVRFRVLPPKLKGYEQ